MTGDGDLTTLLVTFGVVFVGVLATAYLFGSKPAKAPAKAKKQKKEKKQPPPQKKNGHAAPPPKKNGHAAPAEPQGSSGAGAPRQAPAQPAAPKEKRKRIKKKNKSQSPPREAPAVAAAPVEEAPAVVEQPSDDGWTVVAEEKPRKKKEKKVLVKAEPDVDVVECGQGAAAVVGRGGETIKKIETESGAKLNLDKKNSTCEIRGDSEQRKKAKALVLETLEKAGHGPDAPTKSSITVEGGSSVNRVIGAGGSTIKFIQEASGAKVDVGRGGDSVVTISGTSQQLSEAKALVERALRGDDVSAASSQTVDLGARGCRILTSKQGAAIKVLREVHPVRYDIRRGDGRGTSRDTCIISGDADEVTEAVVALKALLADHSTAEELTLECRVGAILGKGGSKISAIQEQSGANVDIQANGDECEVSITGTNAQVAAAKRLVLKACAESKAPPPVPPGEVREQVPVPNESRGAVVGRGGATISSIQSETGARLDLIDGSDGMGACVITGKQVSVDEAVELVKAAVDKHQEIAARDAARNAPAPVEGDETGGFEAAPAGADGAWATPEGEEAWGA